MNKIYLPWLFVFLTACGSVSLSEKAALVRQIQPDWANQCEFIATGEAKSHQGHHPGACMANAQKLMRNQVAELGGNAYVQTHDSSDLCLVGGAAITYEAYRCPDLRK